MSWNQAGPGGPGWAPPYGYGPPAGFGGWGRPPGSRGPPPGFGGMQRPFWGPYGGPVSTKNDNIFQILKFELN